MKAWDRQEGRMWLHEHETVPAKGKVAAVVPRWEWRTFFSDGMPGELRDRLSVGESAPHAGADTHILSIASPHSVRIYHGRLGIRLLVETDRGLERWRPVLRTPFPVDAAAIRECFAAWDVRAPVVIPRLADADTFLREIVGPIRGLRIVNVRRRLSRITIEGCQGEHSMLTIDGHDWEMLAVEHEDPERLLHAVANLGLGPRPNSALPAALKQITGFTASPVGMAEEGIW